ncbi:MAG: hypothetical protein P1P74_00335 [Desulfuromonadales bacterium]|nr:hypothetical protein [Desulfuromonadales bacterium]MDT8423092.1 hypothetical protein [Desulfuromonadales bacterium]
MAPSPLTTYAVFSKSNRRLIFLLISSHLLWSGVIFSLWSVGQVIDFPTLWWGGGFNALQLFAAAQLLLPALLLHPEERSRGFYLFWGVCLALSVWLINQLHPTIGWQPLLAALKSGILLLAGTLIGAALARYVNRLWEIVPVCVVMTLADFISWLHGPTAGFAREIKTYYLYPVGTPPLIDMILVKLAFPGSASLVPVFGISDWIMVVFFAIVARRHGVNDNLAGGCGETLARQGQIGRYLPVSVVALFVAIILAQLSGGFIPALPLIALTMLLWYGVRYLLLSR